VVIDEESILRAKDQIFESEEEINNLFWSLIPGITLKPRDSRSYKYYDMVTIDKGGIVTSQNEIGDYVYLIKEGECQAYMKKAKKQIPNPSETVSEFGKTFRIKSNYDPNIKLFISGVGYFVGEEILFNNDGIYNYTIKVLSISATFFRLEKQKLINKFSKSVLSDLKKIYEQKLFSHGKVLNQKVKPLNDDYSHSMLLRLATERESGFLSARSDTSQKFFPTFKMAKSTDNSPQYSDTSPSVSSKSSDDEAAKDFAKRKGENLTKKSEFMKYAKKIAEESKDVPEDPVGGSFSPSKRARNVNNIADFKLKFETPVEGRSPKKLTSPRAKLAKLGSNQEISPRTLNEILDQTKPHSPRNIPNLTNLASSIVLHERTGTKKLSMTPRINHQFECVSITSLGKIPEPKTVTNLDMPSSTNLDTFSTALKSPRSFKTLKQRLELKPTVIKTLGRIQTKT
jgi:CRP-like cAMP-binding protein